MATIADRILADFVNNDIEFVTTVPCKQLAGVIAKLETCDSIYHIPSNKEDEGMGLCAGAFMGGKRPAIIMQNTAIGVTINTLATLTQYYRMPLPMLISYRGERAAAIRIVELLGPESFDELDAILKYTFMCNKPVAILTDATFWKGY